MPAGEALKG